MPVELRPTGFDPFAEMVRHQEVLRDQGHAYGATACFIGTMRDFNEGEPVTRMLLEHYPGMTERHLDQILEAARVRWRFLDALVIHRTGEVLPGDPIVLVSVWSSHRGAAFDACRYIMEELKSGAPFWKRETVEEGERWVESNTSGY